MRRAFRPRILVLATATLWLFACFGPNIPPSGLRCSADGVCPSGQRCEPATSACVPEAAAEVARLRFEPFASFEAGVEATGVRVSLLDAQDQVVPISGGHLDLELGTAPINVVLAETPEGVPVDGVVNFSKLRIDAPARRLKLVATGGGLTTTSDFFDVLPTRPDVKSGATPTSVQGCAEIPYVVSQAQSRPVDLLVEVDPDGPGGPLPFRRARQAASAPGKAGVQGVRTSTGGAAQVFTWSSSHYAYDTIGPSVPDHETNAYLLDLDADGKLDYVFTDQQRGSALARGR